METQDWLVNIVIVLVVILVISGIVYLFFPDAWTRVSEIADEVFGISVGSKSAENTTMSIKTMISSIASCIESGATDCGCSLNRGSMPEGYKILLKNEANGLSITGLGEGEEIVSPPKLIAGLKVSLAQVSEYDLGAEKQSDIICKAQNLVIRNEKGAIRVYTMGQSTKGYAFYTDAGLDLPEILRKGNELCLVTTAIEHLTPLYNFKGVTYLTNGANVTRLGASYVLNYFRTNNLCSNAATADYPISWPISPASIRSITACANLHDNALGVGISATPDSRIIVPLQYAVVTDFCTENCEGGKKSITMYEVYNDIANWPTGRYVTITGIDNVMEGVEKGKVGGTKIEGKVLTRGTQIASGSDIEFIVGYKDMPSNKHAIRPQIEYKPTKEEAEKLLCRLPHLDKDAYGGKGCDSIAKLIESGCDKHKPSMDTATQITNLGRAIAALKEGDRGSMTFAFDIDTVLVGFEKGMTGNKCGGRFGEMKKPANCGDNACICLCKKPGTLSSNPECEYNTCAIFDETGFMPLFMKGGKDCNYGPYIEGKKTAEVGDSLLVFTFYEIYDQLIYKVYFERKGKTVGLCTQPPCIIETY